MTRYGRRAALLGGLLLSAAGAMRAVAQTASDDSWHYVIEPYAMAANLEGTVGVGNLPNVSIDENFSDILNHLQGGAMLYAEAHNSGWAFSSDLLYMKLAESANTGPVIGYGRATIKQVGWELAALYRAAPWLEVGFAGTLNSIQSELNLSLNTIVGPPRNVDQKMTQTWVDPSFVARMTFPLSPHWYLQGRFNVGGFDIASTFAYQVQVDAAYVISDLMRCSFGYRVIGDEYQTGSGADRFLYHTTTFGPVVRFAFTF
jgi:hypothetical protein